MTSARPARRRTAAAATLAVAALLPLHPTTARAADDDDDAPKQTYPNVYLDLRTNYARVPAGALSLGFGSATSTALSRLRDLASLPQRAAPSLPSSQSVSMDVPLSVDLNDQVTLYGGFSAGTSNAGDLGWSALDIWSWDVGIQADVYQQNGGMFPTITVQSTLTRTVPTWALATTSLNTIVEAGYAFDADETRGVLAGVQITTTAVDADLASVQPNLIGYLGGYYQGDNNWKFTGRAGVQSFGGAQLLRFTPVEAFTQPILRFDLDKMDDNDNRLFGVTAQIAWTPKPAYQLTIRTPLYLTKN